MLRLKYIFPFVYSVYVFLVLLMRAETGWLGVDFAIFAQVIDQVSKTGQPLTSLIDIHWQNFLTHHFSLFFYPLGWVNLLIKNPVITLILYNSLNVFFILYFLFLIAETQKHSSLNSFLFVLLLTLHPSFRAPILWDAHDENFALPFILAAVYFYIKK